MSSQEIIGQTTGTSRPITLGAGALISSTSSCATSAWGLKGGRLMQTRNAKTSSSISVTEFFSAVSTVSATRSEPCWVLSLSAIQFLARALRLIFLAAPAGSLVAVRGQSIRHLLNREKASTLCRLSVILTPRRGQSVRLAVEWKFGSPRTLAGSVISAGTLWTDLITTSVWSAQV